MQIGNKHPHSLTILGKQGSSFGIWPADTRETTPPALLRYDLTLRLSRVPCAIPVEPPQSGSLIDLRCACAHVAQITHCMAISGTGERITSRCQSNGSISRRANLGVKFTRRHTSDVPPPLICTIPRPMMTICMNLMTDCSNKFLFVSQLRRLAEALDLQVICVKILWRSFCYTKLNRAISTRLKHRIAVRRPFFDRCSIYLLSRPLLKDGDWSFSLPPIDLTSPYTLIHMVGMLWQHVSLES